MFSGPATLFNEFADGGSCRSITLMRDFPVTPASAYCRHSLEAVPSNPILPDAQKHNEEVLQPMCSYIPCTNRLFADERCW